MAAAILRITENLHLAGKEMEMETNIIIKGLEEYQETVKEVLETTDKLRKLQEKLWKIAMDLKPRAEIKRPPVSTEGSNLTET